MALLEILHVFLDVGDDAGYCLLSAVRLAEILRVKVFSVNEERVRVQSNTARLNSGLRRLAKHFAWCRFLIDDFFAR